MDSTDKVAFSVQMAEEQYGEGQRAAIATYDIKRGTQFQVELALVWVSATAIQDDAPNEQRLHEEDFFRGNGMFPDVPEFLATKSGSFAIYITWLLIRDHSEKALVFIDEESGLHGHHDSRLTSPKEVFVLLQGAYFQEMKKEKQDQWTVENVSRLYCVVQANYKMGQIPMHAQCYGAGFFPGMAFYNHSCTPNAIMRLVPGRVYVTALTDIKRGTEITLSYKELPIDLISPHMRRLVLKDALCFQCLCGACKEHFEPVNELPTPVDLWGEQTQLKFKEDAKLRTLVVAMMSNPRDVMGAAAAYHLMTNYAHYLKPPRVCKECLLLPTCTHVEADLGFIPELAYMLSEMFCTMYMANEKVTAEMRDWWINVFFDTIDRSCVSLYDSIELVLCAKTLHAFMSGISRKEDEAGLALRKEDTHSFLSNLVALRQFHREIFGHTAFLIILINTHPMLGKAIVSAAPLIHPAEGECFKTEETED
jgi:hypothetical protein